MGGSAMSALSRLELELEQATTENIAPFGELLAFGRGRPVARTRFYDDAVELMEKPAFSSDADTCLSLARVHPRPLEVIWMERHFKHTQAFIPLNAKPWCAVLAPPTASDLPDLAQARAFHFAGDCGLLMHVGTWHEFPFALEVTADMVVVLRNETNRNLEAISDGEAVGEDLEKRHIAKRFGVSLAIRRSAGV
ncbi:MAG: ureidoglycolate hydrolase [Gammaproteobacteria bacterium]|jgi:ureidoglycolate lyase|nr:ureidoglycolate hydrolase [Gammaproteobacteria bacterium]NBP07646.1 ureidoglycolate hydrolase [Gammaproteobacteria bacterium]NBR17401.1 ureidoglycolate hydrolase [Gammaproteobacteria bacterium]NCW21043.1 ureidoglycolate hydrolase [Gammaproteobacteria bacterium]NCW56917.1 ureidoglycolate hydrolase [Gammaproteobacteria bacterium]